MSDIETEITVLVLTYNPKWKSLKKTLSSILEQIDILFEVIVSDDGSSDFNRTEIEQFFLDNKFDNYIILDNKVNRGTVNNVRHAITYVKSRYIKLISPGDYFYSNTSLKYAVDFLKEKKYCAAFGRAVYYSYVEKMEIINSFAPYNILCYKHREKAQDKINKKILKFYIKYLDLILGAATIAETKIVKEYIDKIYKDVRLAEDTMYMLMVADNIQIGFFDEPFVYYEYGTGVSTNTKDCKKMNVVYDDVKNALSIIKKNHPELMKFCDYTLICDRGIKRFFRRINRKIYIVIYSKFVGKIENYIFLRDNIR